MNYTLKRTLFVATLLGSTILNQEIYGSAASPSGSDEEGRDSVSGLPSTSPSKQKKHKPHHLSRDLKHATNEEIEGYAQSAATAQHYLKKWRDEKQELREQLNESEVEVLRLQRELAHAQNQPTATSAHLAELDQVRALLARVQQEKDYESAKLTQLQKSTTDDRSRWDAALAEKEKELAAAKAKETATEIELDKLRKAQSERDRLKNETETELARLKTQLSQQREMSNEELARLEKEKAELLTRLHGQQAGLTELETLKAQLAALPQPMARLLEDAKSLPLKVQKLMQLLEDAQKRAAFWENHAAEYERSLKDNVELQQRQQKLKELQTQKEKFVASPSSQP